MTVSWLFFQRKRLFDKLDSILQRPKPLKLNLDGDALCRPVESNGTPHCPQIPSLGSGIDECSRLWTCTICLLPAAVPDDTFGFRKGRFFFSLMRRVAQSRMYPSPSQRHALKEVQSLLGIRMAL
jgi:hypothetical protein